MSPIAVIGKYIIEAVFHKIRVPRKHLKTFGKIVFLKKINCLLRRGERKGLSCLFTNTPVSRRFPDIGNTKFSCAWYPYRCRIFCTVL